jgi:hypothetical protein
MKPLKSGELRYNGRKVNTATFNISRPQGKDLRRLMGRCSCGEVLHGREAIPHPDPYSSAINYNDTPVVQCDACDAESCAAI